MAGESRVMVKHQYPLIQRMGNDDLHVWVDRYH